MTEAHTTISDMPSLELPLKTLLEGVLSFLERFVTSQSEIEMVESKLHDYESINELVQIITEIWSIFSSKLTERLETLPSVNAVGSASSSEEYRKLEENLQKHESQIRNHIAIEQQLRLCAETFQSKIEELEREKERMLQEKEGQAQEIATLKVQLFDSNGTIERLQRTIRNCEKTIENNDKAIEDMKRRLRAGVVSEEGRHSNLTHRDYEQDGSPGLKQQNKLFSKQSRILDNFVTLKDYLKLKKPKALPKAKNFEEIGIPVPKAFAEITQIYGSSLTNILKTKKKLNVSSNHPQNHIINMNFPKNQGNSGSIFNPKNAIAQTNLNINFTNLTNSLIVNQSNNHPPVVPYIGNAKPRRSRSQGSFKKKAGPVNITTGLQGISIIK